MCVYVCLTLCLHTMTMWEPDRVEDRVGPLELESVDYCELPCLLVIELRFSVNNRNTEIRVAEGIENAFLFCVSIICVCMHVCMEAKGG